MRLLWATCKLILKHIWSCWVGLIEDTCSHTSAGSLKQVQCIAVGTQNSAAGHHSLTTMFNFCSSLERKLQLPVKWKIKIQNLLALFLARHCSRKYWTSQVPVALHLTIQEQRQHCSHEWKDYLTTGKGDATSTQCRYFLLHCHSIRPSPSPWV